jgi:hypothetical protein
MTGMALLRCDTCEALVEPARDSVVSACRACGGRLRPPGPATGVVQMVLEDDPTRPRLLVACGRRVERRPDAPN